MGDAGRAEAERETAEGQKSTRMHARPKQDSCPSGANREYAPLPARQCCEPTLDASLESTKGLAAGGRRPISDQR